MNASHLPLALNSRAIPLSRAQVVQLCEDRIDEADLPAFLSFTKLLTAWYHHEYHSFAEALKDEFDGNAEAFVSHLTQVLVAGNFKSVTREDLEAALEEESLFKLRLSVDFDDFDELVFFRRGPSKRRAQVSQWFGLRSREIEFTNYDMVLVFARFRQLRGDENEHKLGFKPGTSILKLFGNVPKADLEMLFPNTRIRMRLTDKLLIGVPAFFSGVVVLTTKIGGTLLLLSGALGFWLGFGGEPVTLDQSALIALITGAGALGGYLWKQYSNFKNRKLRFMKTLTENLYFKTLAHNEGVVSYLIDRAEESETKEALLAYTALSEIGPASLNDIKMCVQSWLPDGVDFEVDDALGKLKSLELARQTPDGWVCVDLTTAYRYLDQRWDDLFV